MNKFFKYKSLKSYLNYIRDNYPIMTFSEWKSQNGILLRHDVDFDIESAFKMALVEITCGVRSTYFITMSAYMYNPLAEENRNILRKMAHFNFEMGLHFDPTIYSEKDLENAIVMEASALEFVIGKKVTSISLHDSGDCKKYPFFDNYINAHDNSIFSSESYLSDSNMDFKGKDPYEFVKAAANKTIQVSLHPCYYTK